MLNVDQHNSNIKQQKPMTCEVASHFILETLQLHLIGFKKDSEELAPVINFSQSNATQTFKWTNQSAKANEWGCRQARENSKNVLDSGD